MASLSIEHQEGLLFVTHLKEGLNNRTEISRLAKYVGWFWRHHIRPHFFQEEKILIPQLAAGHILAIKLQDDHHEIRELMIAIDHEVERFDLSSLAGFIESHIRWEESVFFDYLEKNLPAVALENISEKIKEHPVHCEVSWDDKFWKTNKEDRV